MKLINTKLSRLTNSIAYDYGYRCLYNVERYVIDEIERYVIYEIELFSLGKLPMHIDGGWYLYEHHIELVSVDTPHG